MEATLTPETGLLVPPERLAMASIRLPFSVQTPAERP